MPTLLLINVVANFGGYRENDRRNWLSSHIAYGRGNLTSKLELIRIGNDWDMHTHALEYSDL